MSTSLKSIKSVIPLLDRVLVQRVKAQVQTASGLYIPEKNQEKLSEANVMAVGPGAPDAQGTVRPVSVQAGDRVLIPQFGGSKIKVGEDDYLLFRDNEILAKIQQ